MQLLYAAVAVAFVQSQGYGQAVNAPLLTSINDTLIISARDVHLSSNESTEATSIQQLIATVQQLKQELASVRSACQAKANASDVYTKQQIDAMAIQSSEAQNAATSRLQTDMTTGRTVASFIRDFATTTEGPWSYLWNKDGAIGNSSNYSPLVYNASHQQWTIYGTEPGDDDGRNPVSWLTVSQWSVHPGASKLQGAAADRFAIMAYTVPEAGIYTIRNLHQRWNPDTWATADGHDLRIYVNDRLVTVREQNHFNNRTQQTISVFVGSLLVNDTIYVCVGPRQANSEDTLRLDFDIAYGIGAALKPDEQNNNDMPLLNGAALSTSVYLWSGQLSNRTWTTVFSASDNVLRDRGVYITKVVAVDEWTSSSAGSHWLSEALVSRPLIWYSGPTAGEDADPIPTHSSGQASNGSWLQLRTKRMSDATLELQMRSNNGWAGESELKFTFLQLM